MLHGIAMVCFVVQVPDPATIGPEQPLSWDTHHHTHIWPRSIVCLRRIELCSAHPNGIIKKLKSPNGSRASSTGDLLRVLPTGPHARTWGVPKGTGTVQAPWINIDINLLYLHIHFKY